MEDGLLWELLIIPLSALYICIAFTKKIIADMIQIKNKIQPIDLILFLIIIFNELLQCGQLIWCINNYNIKNFTNNTFYF